MLAATDGHGHGALGHSGIHWFLDTTLVMQQLIVAVNELFPRKQGASEDWPVIIFMGAWRLDASPVVMRGDFLLWANLESVFECVCESVSEK